MAPVCKFWQQGSCRYGERCKFEHPSPNQNFPNGNRFAPLQNQEYPRNTSFHGGARQGDQPDFGLDKAAILTDLQNERPQWILSAYGPGRQAPAQLFGGPVREQSFEEIRLLHYTGIVSGNAQQAAQEADKLFQASEQQIQTVVNNIDGAIKYIIDSGNDHPNRVDICKSSTNVEGGFNPNPGTGSFPTNRTGSNAFGAPTQPSNTHGFGKPLGSSETFGQATTPAFGAPSGGFAKPATSAAFGTTQPVSTTGSFGQPSAMGQKQSPFSAPTQAFGAPSQLGATGGFGRPSTLGQKPNPFATSSSNGAAAPFAAFTAQPNSFSQQAQAAPNNGFGTTAQAPAQNAFASSNPSPFGAPSGQTPAPNAFAPSKPSPFGAPSGQNPSPFAAATQSSSTNVFGQPSGQSAFAASNPSSQPTPFGGTSSSTFGAPSSAPANPFQTPATQIPAPVGRPFAESTPQSNPFLQGTAQPAAQNPFKTQPTSPAGNPFQKPSQAPGNTTPTPISGSGQFAGYSQPSSVAGSHAGSGSWPQHPKWASYSSLTVDGKKLQMFKGKPVVYHGENPGIKSSSTPWQRIWCPKGFPELSADTEMDDSLYDEKIEVTYKTVRQTGAFPGGVMPMIPPKREWCRFDF